MKSLGVKGLTGSSGRPLDRDVFQFDMRYHGKTFVAELSGMVLASDRAKFAVAEMTEKLVAEICEWLASSLEQMVSMLPRDWDGDRRPEKPTNTWENLFKDEG